MHRIEDQTPQAKQLLEMESYGSIDERSAATPPKLGRRIIAAVAAVALAARCAKPLNGLTDCTDLCRKFPNAGHTTTCCKCYPAC